MMNLRCASYNSLYSQKTNSWCIWICRTSQDVRTIVSSRWQCLEWHCVSPTVNTRACKAIVMQQCLGLPASIPLCYIQTLPVSIQIEFGHLISSPGKKCFYKVNNRQSERKRERWNDTREKISAVQSNQYPLFSYVGVTVYYCISRARAQTHTYGDT